jgi:polar amino acid transport system substrate-binding protein
MSHFALFKFVLLISLSINCSEVISANSSIRICYEANHFPPYSFEKNSVPVGILVDLIDYASQETDQPIELYSNSWNRCQQDVIAGRAQALFAMVSTEKRQKKFAFPPPENLNDWHMWLAQYPVFTPKNSEFDVNTYNPQKGMGAPLGYVVWNILEQRNWLTPFQYEPIQGFKMLAVNKLDGYVVERLIGLNLIQENNLTSQIRMNEYSVLDTKWYLPFNKDFYNKNKSLVHNFWMHMAAQRKIAKHEFEKAEISQ